MNHLNQFGIFLLFFGLLNCSQNRSLNDNSIDIMSPAGGSRKAIDDEQISNMQIKPGEFLTIYIPNTGFYNQRPVSDTDADQLLALGSNIKVIRSDSSYTQVELDSGRIGWVATIMLNAQKNAPTLPGNNQPNYEEIPTLTPENPSIEEMNVSEIPESIPTIIDPDEASEIIPTEN